MENYRVLKQINYQLFTALITTMNAISLLEIPEDVKLFETPIATYWVDDDGILYGINKNVERTLEHYQDTMELFQSLMKNGEKLCLITDASNAFPLNKEVSDFVSTELHKYIKAGAIITTVPLSATLTKTFLRLIFSGLPLRLFQDVEDAQKWLKDHL